SFRLNSPPRSNVLFGMAPVVLAPRNPKDKDGERNRSTAINPVVSVDATSSIRYSTFLRNVTPFERIKHSCVFTAPWWFGTFQVPSDASMKSSLPAPLVLSSKLRCRAPNQRPAGRRSPGATAYQLGLAVSALLLLTSCSQSGDPRDLSSIRHVVFL